MSEGQGEICKYCKGEGDYTACYDETCTPEQRAAGCGDCLIDCGWCHGMGRRWTISSGYRWPLWPDSDPISWAVDLDM